MLNNIKSTVSANSKFSSAFHTELRRSPLFAPYVDQPPDLQKGAFNWFCRTIFKLQKEGYSISTQGEVIFDPYLGPAPPTKGWNVSFTPQPTRLTYYLPKPKAAFSTKRAPCSDGALRDPDCGPPPPLPKRRVSTNYFSDQSGTHRLEGPEVYLTDQELMAQVSKANLRLYRQQINAMRQKSEDSARENRKKKNKKERKELAELRRQIKSGFQDQMHFPVKHSVSKQLSELITSESEKFRELLSDTTKEASEYASCIAESHSKIAGASDTMKNLLLVALVITVFILLTKSPGPAQSAFYCMILSLAVPAVLWEAIKGYFAPKHSDQGPLNFSGVTTLAGICMTFLCFNGGSVFQSRNNIFKNIGFFPRFVGGLNDIGSYVAQVLESVVNWVARCFGKDPVTLFNTGKTEIDAFLKRVETILITDPDSHPDPHAFFEDVLDARGDGAYLIEQNRWAPAFERFISRANDKLDRLIHQNGALISKYGCEKQEPRVLALSGPPGAGKSLCSSAFTEIFAAGILGPEVTSRPDYNSSHYIYVKPADAQYFDGYKKQPVVGYDDFGQEKPVPGAVNPFAELIRIVTCFACQLNKADVGDKGKVYFTSKVIVLSTNLQNLRDASTVILSPEAVIRRFHVPYEVFPQREFSLEHDETKLDAMKFNDERIRQGGAFPWNCFKFVRKNWNSEIPPKYDDPSVTYDVVVREVFAGVHKSREHFTGMNVCKASLIQEGHHFFSESERLLLEDIDSKRIKGPSGASDQGGHHSKQRPHVDPNLTKFLYEMGELDDEPPESKPVSEFEVECLMWEALAKKPPPFWSWLFKISKTLAMAGVAVIVLKLIYGAITTSISKLIDLVKCLFGKCDKKEISDVDYISHNVRRASPEFVKNMRENLESHLNNYSGKPMASTFAAAAGINNQSNELPARPGRVKAEYHNQSSSGSGPAEALNVSVLKNQFHLHTMLGDATFLSGAIVCLENAYYIMPAHFIDVYKRTVATGEYDDNTKALLVNAHTPKHRVTIPYTKLMSSVVHVDSQRDVAFLHLPNLQRRSSIVDKFITLSDVPSLSNADVRLEKVVLDGNEATHLVRYSPSKRLDAIPIDNPGNPALARKLVQGWVYPIPTVNGDCGSLLTLVGHHWTGCRRILGFHSAGDGATGISNALTQEYLKQVLKSLGSIQCVPLPTTPAVMSFAENQSGEPLATVSRKLAVSRCPATSLFKTKFFNYLGPFDYTPACLTKKAGVCPMAKIRNQYTRIAPLLDDEKIDRATYEAFKPLNARSVDDFRGILTFREAVAGKPEVPYCNGLTRATSAGWPLCTELSNGKRDIFGYTDEYNFNTPEALKLEQEVLKVENLAREGVRSLHVYVDFLKDELRSQAKFDSCETRMISACPLPYAILFRKYFMAFTASVQKHRLFVGPAVGTNPYTEWNLLAKLLHSKGRKIVAGDYKGFDYTASPQVHKSILDAIQAWYGDEHYLVRRVLWEELTNSIHLSSSDGNVSDQLYALCGCMPSGFPGTSVVNCYDNIINMIMAYEDLTERHASTFWEHVMLVVYGDDNVMSIDDQTISLFNQNTIPKAMRAYGREYTNDRKDEQVTPDYRTLEEVTFLKRSFVQCENTWLAPLELKSVLSILYWAHNKKDLDDTLVQNFEGTLQELSLHSPSVWDQYAPKVIAAAAELISTVPSRKPTQTNYQTLVSTRVDTWW